MAQRAVLDRNHLARITLGEEALEREVLALFHRQSAMLVARMPNQTPRVIAALAHTLTGSARGVGAWHVAAAAEAVERAATGREQAGIEEAISRLSRAVTQAQAAIARLTQLC
jgi:HPt (histidine-containing phosphotransfer) domain-containing protein